MVKAYMIFSGLCQMKRHIYQISLALQGFLPFFKKQTNTRKKKFRTTRTYRICSFAIKEILQVLTNAASYDEYVCSQSKRIKQTENILNLWVLVYG